MPLNLKIGTFFVFKLSLGFFSINFFTFRSFSRFFVKNQLIWQVPFDNSYTQRLFLPRCTFVLKKCKYADPNLVVFFQLFSVFLFVFWFYFLEIVVLFNMSDFNFVLKKYNHIGNKCFCYILFLLVSVV